MEDLKDFFSQISWSEEAKLIVWDVGHGNWNEVRIGNNRIFFDIGADKYVSSPFSVICTRTLHHVSWI